MNVKIDKLRFKQSSASRSKYLPELLYALSQVTQQGYYTCWSWPKTDMNSFLVKGRQLIVDEKGYAS